MSLIEKIDKIESGMLTIFSIGMIAMITFQVINRTIIQLPIGWAEEFPRYSMILLAFFGAEIGLRDGSQINITSFTSKLSKQTQKWIDCFATFVVCAFCGVVFISSIMTLQLQFRTGQISAAMRIPMWIPYLIVTVSLAVMTLTQGLRLIGLFIGTTKTPEQTLEPEEK